MEKFVPFEKLSKKKQRALNAQKRGSWGAVNPVTRKPQNPKAYNRKKLQSWKDDSGFAVSFLCMFPAGRRKASASRAAVFWVFSPAE